MVSGTSEAFDTSNPYIKFEIKVKENSYSVQNNTSNVTVTVRFWRTNTGYQTYGTGTVYCFIYNDTYSQAVSSDQKITNYGIDLFEMTLDIPHNDDGTRNLNVAAYISHERVTSESYDYYIDLTTIPRASEFTCPTTWTLGQSITFKIDRKSSSFRDTLSYDTSSTEYSETLYEKTAATTLTYNLTKNLANLYPNSTRGMVVFVLTTYDSNGNSIGSTRRNAWFVIPDNDNDFLPKCSLSLTDTSSITVNGTKKSCLAYFGAYVAGVSTIRAKIAANGAYGSTIKSYSGTYPGGSFSSNQFDIPTRELSGSCKIKVSASDTRDRICKAEGSANVVAYSPPSVTALSVHRCASETDGTENDQGGYTQVTYGYAIYNIANSGKNAKSAVLKYKKSTDSAWSTQDLTANAYTGSGSVIIQTSTDSSYDILLTVSDSITSSSKSTSVSTGYCIYHIPASGKGITIGGIAESEGFNVKMPATFSGPITAGGNYNGKYVTGTWLQTTQATDLGRKPSKVAVLDESGWVYSRALSSLILEAVYPVGSIYMSVNSTSPATLFGGTWQAIKGKFLLGQSNAHKAGTTGGEENHTLTVDEMPKHTHSMYSGNSGGPETWEPDGGSYLVDSVTQDKHTWWASLGMNYAGGGAEHNNMPPYLAVYIWKRTG